MKDYKSHSEDKQGDHMTTRSMLLYQWTNDWQTNSIYCMYEILITGPLYTSEYAGEYSFSANLCKRVLDVTAGVTIEGTRNADMLTINASEDFQ